MKTLYKDLRTNENMGQGEQPMKNTVQKCLTANENTAHGPAFCTCPTKYTYYITWYLNYCILINK